MTDFDALQHAVTASVGARQAEANACEALLGALYQALRHASGPGLPLNNVTLDLISDPAARVRPPPVGSAYTAWYRLGLCEVWVRVWQEGPEFVGEYGVRGHFRLRVINENEMLALARQVLRALTTEYTAQVISRAPN